MLKIPSQNDTLKILAFGLVALNPKLIGINSQATNDSFVILFSTAALYAAFLFFRRQRLSTFVVMLVCSALAIASKTNGWVTMLTIAVALAIKLWAQAGQRRKAAGFLLAFLLGVPLLTLLNPLSQYLTNLQKYGSPVMMNIDRQPLPQLFTWTFTPRAGVTSIKDGFFTFKYISLLGYPRDEKDNFVYPAHRTSLWSQLYGRSQSVHFDNYPISWATSGKEYFLTTRLIFLLALPPILLLLIGAILAAFRFLKDLFRRNVSNLSQTSFGLFPIVFFGFLAFVVLYALQYRSYAVMKAIFIYPALISFPAFFLEAAEKLVSFFRERLRWIPRLFEAGLVLLFGLYLVDVITLILNIQTYYAQFR